jgi:uncharacterized protein YbaP (TraB family)
MLPRLFALWAAGVSFAGAEPTSVWNVEGGKAPLALCGSIHFLPASAHPLPAAFDNAYAASEIVVFEILMDELFKPSALQAVHQAMTVSADSKNSGLSPAVRKRLHESLTARGLPPALFDTFQPWAIAQQLALIELQQHGISPAYGVDLHYTNKAKRDGKQRLALETLEQQLGFLQSMASMDADELITQTLDQLPRAKEDFNRLAAAWRQGERETMAELMKAYFQNAADLDETLLRARNRAWIPQLEALLQGERPVMVIVGAGHLSGPENVIDLLEDRGYTVRSP